MRSLVVRLGLVAGAAVLALGAYAGSGAWRVRSGLYQAKAKITRGDVESARRLLTDLAASHPGGVGGEVDYWLGVCEALRGRDLAALAAFSRVPGGFAFDPNGAYLEARANLQTGHLRAAERRLVEALARGGPGLNNLRSLLVRVYEIQVRYSDAIGPLRDSLAEAPDPAAVLSQLWSHDQQAIPLETLRATLDEAGRKAPDDDRVWLGRARLAITKGHWDEADAWLRRCLDAPDDPVWIARLDWARGADRPDDALTSLRRLSPGRLGDAARLSWRAWLLGRRGEALRERQALERLLEIEPKDRQALSRLAELVGLDGQAERAEGLRRRLAAIEQALDEYRRAINSPESSAGAPTRLALGRLAEAAGRRFDARAWYALALKADRSLAEASQSLARLDASTRREAAQPQGDPWADLGPSATPARDTPASATAMFTDDAEAAGLKFVYHNGRSKRHQLPETMGGGVALLDYDGDGNLDVYLVQGGSFPPESPPSADGGDRLFRNLGGGRFEDVTERTGLAGRSGFGFGVAVGDFDNDGRPDLFVTRWRRYALYRNVGGGRFEDVSERAGLGGDRGLPTSAAFADLDGDGDLDLYVCHYCSWDAENPRICRDSLSGAIMSCNPIELAAEPDHLFRNDDGRFVDVTREAGIVDRDGRGLGVVAADLDDDGRVDLFVANDMSANFFWKNLGGLRFEEAAELAGVASGGDGGYRAGMGVARGDLDGDGRVDLCVTNFFGEATAFFRDLGSGLFADHADASGIAAASRPLLGFGIAAFDANNDGRLDLATANGHVNDLRPHFLFQMPAQLLLGIGRGRFRDASADSGACWGVPRMGRGLAAGDLDNDGLVDLVLVSQNQPVAYFHNRTERPGRALTLRLEGRESNRDGVGARVSVTAGGLTLVGERFGGGSYVSASDLRLHFGLGLARRVDLVEVRWPSGRIDRHRDLETNAGYLLREGADKPLSLPGFVRQE
jgi:hypothetical protein